jgi:hypothetical protein
MKRLLFLSLFLFWLLLAPMAYASVSEIYLSYPNQVAPLPATPILTAGSSVGSYLICIYLEQFSSAAMTATLAWTDDNNAAHSVSLGGKVGTYYSALCQPIRNQANTAPTLSTSGVPLGSYGVYVVGFGFWTTGTQKQGGISVPGNYSGWPVDQTLVVESAKEATYLLAIQTLTPQTGIGSVTVFWQDHSGGQSLVTDNTAETAVIPIHALANSQITITGTSERSPNSTTQLSLVQFGTPATGSGPLTDYEADLEGWTDATYPDAKTLFTGGSGASFGIVATNVTVAEQGGLAECVTVWSGTTLASHAVCSDAEGSYGSLLLPMAVASNAQVNYWTYNATYPNYGSSPTYSTEVDAIVFSGTPAAYRHRFARQSAAGSYGRMKVGVTRSACLSTRSWP